MQVSAMGMGCWAIGGPWTIDQGDGVIQAGWGKIDDKESVRAIHAGLDMGVTFFDTAANYGTGHSEHVLGQALQGRRDKVVIATKFGFLVDEAKKEVVADDGQVLKNLRKDCENSLRRLNTDYIDIFQLHKGNYEPELARQLIPELEKLVSEGKIRWFGWSTDDPERAKVFAEAEHCSTVQFDLNVIRDNPAMRAVCQDFDLGGINKSPLYRGILTGKFDSNTVFPEDDIRHGSDFSSGLGARLLAQLAEVRSILTEKGHSLPQASLAYIWALDERMVPIPGFKSVKQIQENAGAMELGPLDSEQVQRIRDILQEMQARSD